MPGHPGHLRIVFAGQTTVLLVNKAVQYASFIVRHGDAALDAASDSVRPCIIQLRYDLVRPPSLKVKSGY